MVDEAEAKADWRMFDGGVKLLIKHESGRLNSKKSG